MIMNTNFLNTRGPKSETKYNINRLVSNRWTRKLLKAVHIAIALSLGMMTAQLLKNYRHPTERVEVVPRNVELGNISRGRDLYQQRPTIGILSLCISRNHDADRNPKSFKGRFVKYGNCYVPASYARFIQSAGKLI